MSTLQQRKPLAEEAKSSSSSSTSSSYNKAIPDESDSDDEKDGYAKLQKNADVEEEDPDTDWISAKGVKRHDHDQKQHDVDPETKKFMEAVETLIRKHEGADDKVAWGLIYPPVIAFILLALAIPFFITQRWFVIAPWLFITGGLRVRLFILFHDCGHNALFTKFRDNMRVGAFLELFVGTPFSLWLKRHNRHHRVQGNSDKLDLSSTVPITVQEYLSLPPLKRYVFRVVREPIVFFMLAPLLIWDYFYLIANGTKRIYGSRGAIWLYFAASLVYCCGYKSWLTALFVGALWEQLFTWIPGFIGLTLFHLQHSANSGYRAIDADFNAKDTAVHGSTYLVVPTVLRWITLNIEFHHVHHWSTRVPCYRLEQCHLEGEKLGLWKDVTRIDTWAKLFESLPNALWSDKLQGYIPFSRLSEAI